MLGVLEIAGRGAGFLRRREAGYLPSNGDVHVGERVVRQYGLRTGDEIVGETRPGGKGRGPTLERVTTVHGHPADQVRTRPEFTRLTAIHPNELIRLETNMVRGGTAGLHQPGHRPPLAPGEGPARPDRGARQGGQDHGAPGHRRRGLRELSRKRA